MHGLIITANTDIMKCHAMLHSPIEHSTKKHRSFQLDVFQDDCFDPTKVLRHCIFLRRTRTFMQSSRVQPPIIQRSCEAAKFSNEPEPESSPEESSQQSSKGPARQQTFQDEPEPECSPQEPSHQESKGPARQQTFQDEREPECSPQVDSPATKNPKVLRDSKSFKTNVVRIGVQSWKMFSGPKFSMAAMAVAWKA